MKRHSWIVILLSIVFVALALLLIAIGSVNIPFADVFDILTGHPSDNKAWNFIVFESRIPLMATSALAGAALAVSGLLLQTLFSNPLADPSILGVSTGSSFGVAAVLLISGGAISNAFGGYIAVLGGALVGALIIMSILLVFSASVKSSTMLLILGVILSYLTSSGISLMNFFATQEGVHSFVIWGLGNFSGVTMKQLPLFSILVFAGLVGSIFMVKPLNALLLGSRYAENLGINLRRVRNALLLIAGLLTAIVTAFCGPIGFIGLVVPHMARLMLRTSDHYRLMPVTMLTGAVVAMLCTLISVLPQENGLIPINAITPIIGVPVIIYIILNRRKIFYFN